MTDSRARLVDLKMAAVILAVVTAGALLWRSRVSDIDRCQGIFQRLVDGRASVQHQIDWERLIAMQVDVGAAYRALPNEQERRGYRNAFVEQASKGFRSTGATAGQFVNWRVAQRTPDAVTVAADYPAKKQTLLLSLPARGAKRLYAIAWQGAEAQQPSTHDADAWHLAQRR